MWSRLRFSSALSIRPAAAEKQRRGVAFITYIDGLIPVPPGKKEAYRDMAAKAAPVFQEYGARPIVEVGKR